MASVLERAGRGAEGLAAADHLRRAAAGEIRRARLAVAGSHPYLPSLNCVMYLQGGRVADGFLYGVLDSVGEFTGGDITFLYPDLLTGIRGQGRHTSRLAENFAL